MDEENIFDESRFSRKWIEGGSLAVNNLGKILFTYIAGAPKEEVDDMLVKVFKWFRKNKVLVDGKVIDKL